MNQQSETSEKAKEFAVGIDFGTVNTAVSAMARGKLSQISSPLDGVNIPTIALEDPSSGEMVFGGDALLHASANSGAHLFTHMKRRFVEAYDQPVYDSKYTPQQIIGRYFGFIRELILQQHPSFAEFPQFGGNRRPGGELALYLSMPASWSLEQREALIEAAHMGGFQLVDGVVQEPVAAARRLIHLAGRTLNSGDLVWCIDVGGGTTDISLLRYDNGVFHQEAGSSGNGYLAGEDFTNAHAEVIANLLGVSWEGAFDRTTGFDLTAIRAERRADVLACWLQGSEAKKKLSSVEKALVLVELSSGRTPVEINRRQSEEFCESLYAEFERTVAASLEESNHDFDDIRHVLLVGGGSQQHGLRERVAKTVGRDAAELLYCTDANVVSEGTAEIACFQDLVSQAIPTGLGIIGLNETKEQQRNMLFIRPNEIVPPGGYWLEKMNARLDVQGKSPVLGFRPFVLRPGKTVKNEVDGDILAPTADIVELEPIHQALPEAFTTGGHPIRLGLQINPGGRMDCVITPHEMIQEEPIIVPLQIRQGGPKKEVVGGADLVIVMDCSKSMAGEKLRAAKQAIRACLDYVRNEGAEVALVVFGKTASTGLAQVAADFSADFGRLETVVDQLEAGEGTYIGEALYEAKRLLEHRSRKRLVTTVLFSDGIPHNRAFAIDAADALKTQCQLLTIGLGEDVSESLMKRLATSPDDYFFARFPEDLQSVTTSAAELIWIDSDKTSEQSA